MTIMCIEFRSGKKEVTLFSASFFYSAPLWSNPAKPTWKEKADRKNLHRGSLLQCFRHGFKPAPRVGEEKSELQPFMLAGFGARCLAKLSHCFLVLIVATGFASWKFWHLFSIKIKYPKMGGTMGLWVLYVLFCKGVFLLALITPFKL